jgi:putative ABC transport system permease protein
LVNIVNDREGLVVYGIDPSTFARGAFWDDSFADLSLDEVVDRLATPRSDGRIPAVIVGLDATDAPDALDAGISSVGPSRFEIEQVAHVDAMPGLKRGTPTMYVDAAALDDLDRVPRPTTVEAWIRGDRDDTLATLEAADARFVEERRVGDVVDQASFLTVSWTFGFMQSLGLAAGILVVGGVAVHVEAQRRGRVLGYAFARRMGLRRAQHRRALFVELAASVIVGCALGLAAALAGVLLVYEHIDPVPGFRPDPLLRPATVVIAVVFVFSILLTAIAAAVAQRRTDRDDPAEVLRAGA